MKMPLNAVAVCALTTLAAPPASAMPDASMEGAAPPAEMLTSCVRINDPGPGPSDAPTVVDFHLPVLGGQGAYLDVRLDLVFEGSMDGGFGLTGEQMQARFVGMPAWTTFGEVGYRQNFDECTHDEPDCDIPTPVVGVPLPAPGPNADLSVEIVRTGGPSERIHEACLRATWSGELDGDAPDVPDVGTPEGRKRDASEPGGGEPFADGSPVHPAFDATLAEPGDSPDAGAQEELADESLNTAESGGAESQAGDVDTEVKAQSCSAVSGAPAGLATVLPLTVVLGLRRGRRR